MGRRNHQPFEDRHGNHHRNAPSSPVQYPVQSCPVGTVTLTITVTVTLTLTLTLTLTGLGGWPEAHIQHDRIPVGWDERLLRPIP